MRVIPSTQKPSVSLVQRGALRSPCLARERRGVLRLIAFWRPVAAETR